MSNTALYKRISRATFWRRFNIASKLIREYIKELSSKLVKNTIRLKLNQNWDMKILTDKHEIRQWDNEIVSILFEIDKFWDRKYEPLDLTWTSIKMQVKRKKTETNFLFEVSWELFEEEINRADFQLSSENTEEKWNFVFNIIQTLNNWNEHTRAVWVLKIKDRFEI